MITKIRKIGNSRGIIIPKCYLQDIGFPKYVDINLINNGILISTDPKIDKKIIRRKPRSKDESEGFFRLMVAKIEANLKSGKIRWINNREMERNIDI